MTGRHSVMLRPDSVRRVKPPKTTIPKTLPAERRSHIATERWETSGHDEVDDEVRDLCCFEERIVWLKAPNGEVPDCSTDTED